MMELKPTVALETLQHLNRLQKGNPAGLVADGLKFHALLEAIEECESGSRLIDGADMLRKVRMKSDTILARMLKETPL